MGAVQSIVVAVFQQGSSLAQTYLREQYDAVLSGSVQPLLFNIIAASLILAMHNLYKGRKKQSSQTPELSINLVSKQGSGQLGQAENESTMSSVSKDEVRKPNNTEDRLLSPLDPKGPKNSGYHPDQKLIGGNSVPGHDAMSFQSDLMDALHLSPSSSKDVSQSFAKQTSAVPSGANSLSPAPNESALVVPVGKGSDVDEIFQAQTSMGNEEGVMIFQCGHSSSKHFENVDVNENMESPETSTANTNSEERKKKGVQPAYSLVGGNPSSNDGKAQGVGDLSHTAEGLADESLSPGKSTNPELTGFVKAEDQHTTPVIDISGIGERKLIPAATRQRSSTLTKSIDDGQTTQGLPGYILDKEDAVLEQFKDESLRKEDFIAYQNEQLRKRLGVQIDVYQPGDRRPRHPNHHRTWYSKNLWCTKCHGRCQNCMAWCCKYQESYAIALGNRTSVEVKDNAHSIIEAIRMYNPTGTDNPTFLRCTTEGCRRLVCPECCGICPNQLLCQDLQCVRCKPDPWVECDWHVGL
ncbi:hypothetical protein L228DRAFT_270166 [Xylona heveae TC161]|uniref:Uncharacterized protein n=1 Tax=Xylona heveae (strain CBS 132557 / TC161) TaxID=1328760 RepID=A0A165FF31_XYLHT|nr:hypothetical protein L228DRAFT_270166 [Xylona heveae TC161]KZF20901.1 hypothetical protein L228DRAFT_270166 [Xylona heveae TC161]